MIDQNFLNLIQQSVPPQLKVKEISTVSKNFLQYFMRMSRLI